MKSLTRVISANSALSHSSSATMASSLLGAWTNERSPLGQRHMNMDMPQLYARSPSRDAHRERVKEPAPDETIESKTEECSEARAPASGLGPYEAVRFEYLGFAAIAASVWYRDR